MKKILKFYSPTCGPCKVMSRTLNTLEGVNIQDIDVTDGTNEELVTKYNIRTVPTIIIIEESNEIIKEFHGVVLIDDIKKYIDG